MPPVTGIDSPNVFRLWTVPDMDRISEFLEEKKPASAVIAGGGFIGMEMAEAFSRRGIRTTMVELLSQVMSTMDPEFGAMISRRLEAHGTAVRTGVGVKAIDHCAGTVELTDGSRVDGQIVLMATGVRPELTLARDSGLEIGASGGLQVDEHLRTSDPHIWAAGDMNEIVQKVSGTRVRIPLAGPANRQGRLAATNALGGKARYSGGLGTSVVKVFDATAANTGLTETAARKAGLNVGAALVVKDHHAAYYPGARELVLKVVYDRASGRILGGQAFGEEGVEKRIDSLAVALQGRMTLDDLAEVDLAYAPPYSSANDPLNVAAFVGQNDLSGYAPLVSAQEARALIADNGAGGNGTGSNGAGSNGAGSDGAGSNGRHAVLLDVRNLNEYETAHVQGTLNIPLDELRFRLEEVPRDRPIIVHCRSGFRSHLAVRILKENGWSDVRNLTGGFVAMTAVGGFDIEQ